MLILTKYLACGHTRTDGHAQPLGTPTHCDRCANLRDVVAVELRSTAFVTNMYRADLSSNGFTQTEISRLEAGDVVGVAAR